ncbi:MAG: HEAT repeat domain-containing protein [Pseudomonadota bacterium]
MAFIKKPLIAVTPENAHQGYAQLIVALAQDDSAGRKAAAQQLAEHPQSAELMGARLATEAQASVRAAILTSLIKMNTPSAAGSLIPHLRSEDVGLRNDVISALQQMPDPVALFLPALLRDDDHDVRIFALNIISMLRHAQAPLWLLEVIQTDPHINVCTTAIDALAEIGTPEMVPAIQAAAQRFDSSYTRFAADLAIRRILG